MQADVVFEATKKQKEAGKAWWWQCVSVVLVAVSTTQVLCKLQCKFCKQLLSPSNPPDVCKSHLKQKNCTGYRKGVQEGLIQVEEQEKGQEKGQQQQPGQQQEASTSNKRRATGQLRIDDMKGQRELAKEHLALFFFKNSIPLHLIDDPDLKAAFSLLGCDLPTRLKPQAES
ncbi:hypothetical protein DUNSADRAFT_3459 [Dunaliella salina]|uniref:DUF7963 domain-containing protein n=1 Tax=Dunaliella salina TaxID=3046 RepID=A0ABQ7FVD5_DUNSA|nr:hypothetical protein DUNSADRAFT_3459 [Dunaliella salina]|eukprot:KAF5826352.1 hypothetical protein DUNSADRAFT_3459 [Dunaliella salina]